MKRTFKVTLRLELTEAQLKKGLEKYVHTLPEHVREELTAEDLDIINIDGALGGAMHFIANNSGIAHELPRLVDGAEFDVDPEVFEGEIVRISGNVTEMKH